MSFKEQLVQYLRNQPGNTLAGLFFQKYPLTVGDLNDKDEGYAGIFLATIQLLNEGFNSAVPSAALVNQGSIISFNFHRIRHGKKKKEEELDYTILRLSDLVGSLPENLREVDSKAILADEIYDSIDCFSKAIGFLTGAKDEYDHGFEQFLVQYYEIQKNVDSQELNVRDSSAAGVIIGSPDYCKDALWAIEEAYLKAHWRELSPEEFPEDYLQKGLHLPGKDAKTIDWTNFFRGVFSRDLSLQNKYPQALKDARPWVYTRGEDEFDPLDTLEDDDPEKAPGKEKRVDSLDREGLHRATQNLLKGLYSESTRKDVIKKHFDTFLQFVSEESRGICLAEVYLTGTGSENFEHLYKLEAGKQSLGIRENGNQETIHHEHVNQKNTHLPLVSRARQAYEQLEHEALVKLIIGNEVEVDSFNLQIRAEQYFLSDYIKFQYLQAWHSIVHQYDKKARVPLYSKPGTSPSLEEVDQWFPNFGRDAFQIPGRKEMHKFLENLYRSRVGILKILKELEPDQWKARMLTMPIDEPGVEDAT